MSMEIFLVIIFLTTDLYGSFTWDSMGATIIFSSSAKVRISPSQNQMSSRKKKNRSFQERSPQPDAGVESGFSPVKSPSPSPQRGNLQGSARKLKDAAADWHNYILKWNKLNADGMTIVNKIANNKLEKLFSVENKSEAKTSDLMSPDLEPLCDALAITVQAMEKVVKKMSSLKELVDGVIQLESSSPCPNTDGGVLFHTWGLAEFQESFQELHKMYSKEWKLKRTIAENVAHARDRNLLMVYSSSWLHQPYIEDRAEVLLESLLLETGHKEIT